MTSARPMRFSVDAWDPSYGSALEGGDLPSSAAAVNTDVERAAHAWSPVDARTDIVEPSAILFVDGVRRVDARVWIDDPSEDGSAAVTASPGICASYAAGVVCCCDAGSHLTTAEVRRSLVSLAPNATDIATRHGVYGAVHTVAGENVTEIVALSNALQKQLHDVEVTSAVAARATLETHDHDGRDLLVIDGPLRNRAHLLRALGFIKSHRAEYLPPALNTVVASLSAGQRTPVFLLGTSWDRYAWYLRLPCPPGAPWAGVVRIEAAPHLSADEVTALANVSQAVLPRFASIEYKDARAPQNLVPIAGLERALKHRLGDPQLMYRSLRAAAGS